MPIIEPILNGIFSVLILFCCCVVKTGSVNFKQQGERERFTLIGAGGLRTPGEFLKALALGADAVYIGSIAVIATLQSQMTKALPHSPAPQLALFEGKLKEEFDPEKGSQHLANFLSSCTAEMVMALQAMGKSDIHQLSREDCLRRPRVWITRPFLLVHGLYPIRFHRNLIE